MRSGDQAAHDANAMGIVELLRAEGADTSTLTQTRNPKPLEPHVLTPAIMPQRVDGVPRLIPIPRAAIERLAARPAATRATMRSLIGQGADDDEQGEPSPHEEALAYMPSCRLPEPPQPWAARMGLQVHPSVASLIADDDASKHESTGVGTIEAPGSATGGEDKTKGEVGVSADEAAAGDAAAAAAAAAETARDGDAEVPIEAISDRKHKEKARAEQMSERRAALQAQRAKLAAGREELEAAAAKQVRAAVILIRFQARLRGRLARKKAAEAAAKGEGEAYAEGTAVAEDEGEAAEA